MALNAGLTEVLLQGILRHSSETIFIGDALGRLDMFSRSGEAMLGHAPGDLRGRRMAEIAHDPEEWERLLEACRRRGEVREAEFALRHKTGDPVPGEVILFALRGGGDAPEWVAGIFRDLRPQMALQKNLVRVDRLAEIGRTASDVAHEISNPLSNINQISGWMGSVVADIQGISPEDREELETAVRRIEEQVRRGGRLTRRLLAFAREPEPRKASLPIREILEKSVEFLSVELKQRNVELVFDTGEEPLTVLSDPAMLEQVFVNLLSNALYSLKQKESGGRIVLKTRRRGGHITVEVHDTGVGIPEDIQDRINELFFTTKPLGKGTGLGIPICRNLLRQLGGDMTFESEAGVGATFTVRIPIE